jgi:hypothetical protein
MLAGSYCHARILNTLSYCWFDGLCGALQHYARIAALAVNRGCSASHRALFIMLLSKAASKQAAHKTLFGSPRQTGQCLGGNALKSTGHCMLLTSFAWMIFCSLWEK